MLACTLLSACKHGGTQRAFNSKIKPRELRLANSPRATFLETFASCHFHPLSVFHPVPDHSHGCSLSHPVAFLPLNSRTPTLQQGTKRNYEPQSAYAGLISPKTDSIRIEIVSRIIGEFLLVKTRYIGFPLGGANTRFFCIILKWKPAWLTGSYQGIYSWLFMVLFWGALSR